MRVNQRIALILLGFLFVSGNLLGQKSLLWKITGNGMEKPSYLYGTVHIQDARVFSFDETVDEAILSCERLTGELVMDSIAFDISLLKAVMMPSGTSLKDLYEDSTDYLLVKEEVNRALGPLAMMADKFKPIFLSMMILQMDQMEEPTATKEVPLDMYLQQFALKNEMEVAGIETMNEQMKALDAITLEEQAAMLLDAIKNDEGEGMMEQFDELLEIYLDQDIDKFAKLFEEMDFDQMNASLIVERNQVMADRIHVFIQEKPTFNTFGAGHLPGNNGVIALLEEKGYQVKPVKFKFEQK